MLATAYVRTYVGGTTLSEELRLTSDVMETTKERQHVCHLLARHMGVGTETYPRHKAENTHILPVTNQRIISMKCQLLIQFLS